MVLHETRTKRMAIGETSTKVDLEKNEMSVPTLLTPTSSLADSELVTGLDPRVSVNKI